LTPELRTQLENCHNLPSPPGLATKIIRLANDPEADMSRIAEVLALDPAITTKILRIANSPLYARQRKTENLRQALMVIGLNATISLALSFSLLKSWQKHDGQGSISSCARHSRRAPKPARQSASRSRTWITSSR
jgi:HD-like signal output (HDOD) protein